MSSGVSDQMKVPGNTAKNVEERNIPWSQQVDEASYENLASPTTDDNSAANQSSMQFQYPPFNAKENQNFPSNNYNKPRKSSNNYEPNKKYGGKPAFHNNAKRDDFQPNDWGTHNSRKPISDNPPGTYNRSNRPDDGYAPGKLDNRPSGHATTEEKKSNAPPSTAAAAAAKKTTWASIASQPAKLTSRTTLTTSSHKKKGPGMPPPPMVPGKHNLDVNTWDLPNNNPPPVPSPPLPVEINYAAVAAADVNPDYAATPEIVSEYHDHPDARVDRGGGGVYSRAPPIDFPIDDNSKPTNYNNSSFSRARNSPNGHSRKNWSIQHPLHPSRQPSSVGGGGGIDGGSIATGPMRRGDNSTGPSGGPNRYNDRNRGNYVGSRVDPDSGAYNFRDENSSRNAAAIAGADQTRESDADQSVNELPEESPQAVLDELRDKNNYNPAQIDLEKAALARFFVIKSYSEDDIHRSIKYEIWCSTDHGNKRLDDAFKERHKEGGNILLFFSVNGSGHFCGMAQMMTAVDYNSTSSVWSQDKWKGKFKVKWIYVKDVPNTKLRHIRLENNDNKSVTNSRDTQEVPNSKGVEVLHILHAYKHVTSIFDDFYHYEKKQIDEVSKKPLGANDPPMGMGMGPSSGGQQQLHTQSPLGRHYNTRQNNDGRDRDRDVGRSIGPQKYFGGNGGGGGASFRDRNNVQRGSGGGGGGAYHNNYNDHRRFDSHRTAGGGSGIGERDADAADRENSEYGSRHAQKFDYNRRDERTQQQQSSSSKHNNRERDFSEEISSSGGGGKLDSSCFRTGSREMQKDNEYPNADRNRGTDY